VEIHNKLFSYEGKPQQGKLCKGLTLSPLTEQIHYESKFLFTIDHLRLYYYPKVEKFTTTNMLRSFNHR
jgi:hypothetical protein